MIDEHTSGLERLLTLARAERDGLARELQAAEERERIISATYDGQQQSYRELETLYQASQARALRAEEDAATAIEQAHQAAQRERAAGADMVAIVNAAAAYLAAMTWSPSQDPKWKPGDGIIDYKTPEDRLKKLIKGPGRPGAALLAELEAARAVAEAARTGFGVEKDIERAYAFDPNVLTAAIRSYDEAVKARAE